MYRVTSSINQSIKNISDSIRFMSRSKKRRIYYATAAMTTLTTTGLYIGINTCFLDTVVDQMKCYRYLRPIPLNPSEVQAFEKTVNEVYPQQRDKLKAFNFFGTEMYSLGCLSLPSGARIGIPLYYHFDNPLTIDTSQISLLGNFKSKRSMSSPVMRQLCNALVLSEEAKQYAIAHQIAITSSPAFYLKAFNIGLCTGSSFLASQSINTKFLSKTKVPVRALSFMSCFMVIGVLLCGCIDQMIDEIYDKRATIRTLALGPKFGRGAVEYYEKLLEKNKASFDLLRGYESNPFTEDGGVVKLFGLRELRFDEQLSLARRFSQ